MSMRPPMNVTQKIMSAAIVEGEMTPGAEIALRVDQVLLQDVLGTLAMLEFEAMGLERIRVGLAAQYIDHNLVQADHMNADEHMFLRSACRRFGVWYSKPGNGISHPVHMARFGKPGEVMVGSDSHTPGAGALGMFAIGAGGADVALAMAGQPIRLPMPKVCGVRVVGDLPPWVSAKDVILEMLRRHGTEGGVGRIFEYHGPGLANLSAMDRHVIANMGAEMGATTSMFPADEAVRSFLNAEDRATDFRVLLADDGCSYDEEEELDLSVLEPLIALPSSPGNVVPVREAMGREIYQAYIGSSANPGYRDLAVVAEILRGRQVHDRVSLDINPASRQTLVVLTEAGLLAELLRAGGRIHQAGCNGCIGMGQAPASGRISLRTVPRNFPGRSGTREDSVYLCSPETAAASALTGVITDPRDLPMDYPRVTTPTRMPVNTATLVPPLPAAEAHLAALEKTANVASIPELEPLGDTVDLPVALKTGDDVSTDDIVPAGTRVMPFWSNIPALGQFVYEQLDPGYAERAAVTRDTGGHVIVGGLNYGQGSSRENAALAPRHLGLRVVIARSFARIHQQNLVNFGVLPLTFLDDADYGRVAQGDIVRILNLRGILRASHNVAAAIGGHAVTLRHDLSPRQLDVLVAGGVIYWLRQTISA